MPIGKGRSRFKGNFVGINYFSRDEHCISPGDCSGMFADDDIDDIDHFLKQSRSFRQVKLKKQENKNKERESDADVQDRSIPNSAPEDDMDDTMSIHADDDRELLGSSDSETEETLTKIVFESEPESQDTKRNWRTAKVVSREAEDSKKLRQDTSFATGGSTTEDLRRQICSGRQLGENDTPKVYSRQGKPLVLRAANRSTTERFEGIRHPEPSFRFRFTHPKQRPSFPPHNLHPYPQLKRFPPRLPYQQPHPHRSPYNEDIAAHGRFPHTTSSMTTSMPHATVSVAHHGLDDVVQHQQPRLEDRYVQEQGNVPNLGDRGGENPAVGCKFYSGKKLCRFVLNGLPCKFRKRCKFSHDLVQVPHQDHVEVPPHSQGLQSFGGQNTDEFTHRGQHQGEPQHIHWQPPKRQKTHDSSNIQNTNTVWVEEAPRTHQGRMMSPHKTTSSASSKSNFSHEAKGQSSVEQIAREFYEALGADDIVKALEVVTKANEEQDKLDCKVLESLLITCTTSQKKEKVKVAKETINILRQANQLRPSNLKHYVMALCSAGDLDQATHAIEELRDYPSNDVPENEINDALQKSLQCFVDTASKDMAKNSEKILHFFQDLEDRQLLMLRLIDDLLSIEPNRSILFKKLTPRGVVVLHEKIVRDKYTLKSSSKEQLLSMLSDAAGFEYLLDFFVQTRAKDLSKGLFVNLVQNVLSSGHITKLWKLLPFVSHNIIKSVDAEVWNDLFIRCCHGDTENLDLADELRQYLNLKCIELKPKAVVAFIKLKARHGAPESVMECLRDLRAPELFTPEFVVIAKDIVHGLGTTDRAQMVTFVVHMAHATNKIPETVIDDLVTSLSELDNYEDIRHLHDELQKVHFAFSYSLYMKIWNILEEWVEQPEAAIEVYACIRRAFPHKRTCLFYHKPLVAPVLNSSCSAVPKTPEESSVLTSPVEKTSHDSNKDETPATPRTPELPSTPPSPVLPLPPPETENAAPEKSADDLEVAQVLQPADLISPLPQSPASSSSLKTGRQDSAYFSTVSECKGNTSNNGSEKTSPCSPGELSEDSVPSLNLPNEVDWFISFRQNGDDDRESNKVCADRLASILRIGDQPGRNFTDFLNLLKERTRNRRHPAWSGCSINDSGLTPRDEIFFSKLGVRLVRECSEAEEFGEGYEILHTLHSCSLNYSFVCESLTQTEVLVLACSVCLNLNPPRPLEALEVLRGSNYGRYLKGKNKFTPGDLAKRMTIFSSVIQALVCGELYEEAAELYEKYDCFEEMPLKDGTELANTILIELCRQENIDKACVLFNFMESQMISRSSEAFRTYLNCCELCGKVAKARQLYYSGCLQGIYPQTYSGANPFLCSMRLDMSRAEMMFLVESHVNGMFGHADGQEMLPESDVEAESACELTFVFESDQSSDELEDAKERLIDVLTASMNPPLTITVGEEGSSEVRVDMMSVKRWLRAVSPGTRFRHNIYSTVPTLPYERRAVTMSPLRSAPYLQPGMTTNDDLVISLTGNSDTRDVDVNDSRCSVISDHSVEPSNFHHSGADGVIRSHIRKQVCREATRYYKMGQVTREEFKPCVKNLIHNFLKDWRGPLQYNEQVKGRIRRFVTDYFATENPWNPRWKDL